MFFHTASEVMEPPDSFPKKIRGRGKIRLQARDSKCPVCGDSFECIDERGYLCPRCGTTPRRLYLDIPYKGKRRRIHRDAQGKPLDSNQRAYDMLAHVRVEIENHTFDPSKYSKSELKEYYVMTLCDGFLNRKIDCIAPSYQKDYKRMVGIIRDYFKTMDIRDLRKIHIINFKEYLEKTFKLSGKSIKNILDLFKTFLNYCKNDIEVINIVPAFPEVDLTPFNSQWVTEEEKIALYELVPDEHKPIFAFLMLQGCRPSEVRALKVKNVNPERQQITVMATFSSRTYRERRKGRRSKAVTIPIHSELKEYITERVKNNLPEAFLFVNQKTGHYYSLDTLDRVWAQVREKANLDKGVRLYDATRHSVVSTLCKNGTSSYKASKLIGVGTKMIEERYAHCMAEDLRPDLERLTLNRQQTVSKSIQANEK
jgi:integrase